MAPQFFLQQHGKTVIVRDIASNVSTTDHGRDVQLGNAYLVVQTDRQTERRPVYIWRIDSLGPVAKLTFNYL